jgi:hypothetical protein
MCCGIARDSGMPAFAAAGFAGRVRRDRRGWTRALRRSSRGLHLNAVQAFRMVRTSRWRLVA